MGNEPGLFDGKEQEVKAGEIIKVVEPETGGEEGLVSIAKADIGALENIAQIVAQAEAQVDIRKKVIQTVIKATNEQDWVDQGGKPYLQASGAEKIAPFFNAGVKDIVFKYEEGKDADGEFYRFIYNGTAYIKNRGQIVHEMPEVIGTCSSRDKFFGRKDGKLKSITEVDKSNIQKKARTNLYVNGISRILGLRNLKWDDLYAAGLKRNASAKVSYGKDGDESQETKDIKDKLAEAFSKLLNLRGFTPDAETKRLILKEFTLFKKDDGSEAFAQSVDKLTDKWAQATYGKVKKAIEELEAKATGGGK